MVFPRLRAAFSSLCVIGITLVAGCSGTESEEPVAAGTGVAGGWSTQTGAQTSIHFQLAQTGTALSGSGTLGVPPIAPVSGPATPTYTGDDFTITTGTFDGSNVSFTASLGANPDGKGGFFRGTLAFSGTLSNRTIVGSLTFTPPRTATQVFAAQPTAAATLTQP